MSMTRMKDFADSIDLKGMATDGYGKEFMDTMKMGAYRGIAKRGVANIEKAGMNAYSRGMQYSGAASAKAPAMIQSDMLSQVLAEDNRMFQANEQYKLDNQQRWLNVLAHEDSMEFQQRQLDAQKGDMLDQIGQLASVASIFLV